MCQFSHVSNMRCAFLSLIIFFLFPKESIVIFNEKYNSYGIVESYKMKKSDEIHELREGRNEC